MPLPKAGAPNRQLPMGTSFGSRRWHRWRAELSAGGRVALEMSPVFTHAKQIKQERKRKSDVKNEILCA